MGFAWKSTPKGEPVPDTEFGPDLEAAALNKDDAPSQSGVQNVIDDSIVSTDKVQNARCNAEVTIA